jgi:hypothetical protein
MQSLLIQNLRHRLQKRLQKVNSQKVLVGEELRNSQVVKAA